jgi:hypothetical protein
MKLDDKTTIPLWAVIASLPFIVGAIMWLASVDAKATKAAESSELIQDIHIKIIKIEKDVEYLKEKK